MQSNVDSSLLTPPLNAYSIADEFERDMTPLTTTTDDSSPSVNKQMRLKCANQNDFLFIGLTQYGVHSSSSTTTSLSKCEINQNDCLVTVDYLSNECNGLNTCDIQLDAQFLHTCKNHSNYLSVAYECVPGAKRVDICSNQETFLIDPSTSSHDNEQGALESRFGSFYLSSPNYPNEYGNGLNNCTCKLDYVNIEDETNNDKEVKANLNQINLVLKVSF